MRSEIRGLKSDFYFHDNNSCALDVYKTDKGVNIVHVDYDLETYYHWLIDENGNIVDFAIGLAYDDLEGEL